MLALSSIISLGYLSVFKKYYSFRSYSNSFVPCIRTYLNEQRVLMRLSADLPIYVKYRRDEGILESLDIEKKSRQNYLNYITIKKAFNA